MGKKVKELLERLDERIDQVQSSDEFKEILKTFKEIIKKAHGVKSKDGKRFIKNEETLSGFMDTEAYSELFMEIGFDADKASEFINGILPAGLNKEAQNVNDKG